MPLSHTSSHILIDQGEDTNQRIVVPKDEHMIYVFLPSIVGEYHRHISVESWAQFTGSVIALHNGHITITTEIIGDHATSKLKTLAIATDNAKIDIDGIALVNKPYEQVEIRVDQTNILIGENMRVRSIPQLQIATDDIIGGHSCKMHRLSGDALAYLGARGIYPSHAEALLLMWEIRAHLSSLDNTTRDSLIASISTILQEKQWDFSYTQIMG